MTSLRRCLACWAAVGLALAQFPAGAADPPKEKIPIILDCDIGTDIDDTFALALAIHSPELDLRGVTSVSGDTLARARMCCRLLTEGGRKDVPVAAGGVDRPPQPLRGMQGQYAAHPAAIYHRTSTVAKEAAVPFIYQKLKADPGKITLVAVGPLSNIAQLLTEHPDCKPWIKRIVLMGGSVRVGYDAKAPPVAEFNIRSDPQAAQAVFASGVPLTVAPTDATTMLKLEPAMLQRIWDSGSLLNQNVQCLWQLWDQKEAPILFDPVAVTLVFNDSFCTMEDLRLEIDDQGLTKEVKGGHPNCRVATGIKKDEYLKWFIDRFVGAAPRAPAPKKPGNRSQLIARTGMPHRVHVAEDFETDIEKRWWLSGKAETVNLPPGSTRACRGVLTQDFDDRQGDLKTLYTAVVFNPVPGPPMGKNPRLSFRYWLKGTDTIRVQLYSLSRGYHRYLSITGLPQEKWQEGTVDMTHMRRPDGTGGPLSEEERIDDIQFYVEPTAEILIDDICLYDAAPEGEKRPYPSRFHYTGWFDSGAQGKEWPGTFDIVPKRGYFWNAARSVDHAALDGAGIVLHLRGARPLSQVPHLLFRYRLDGANKLKVVLVNKTQKQNHVVELRDLQRGGDWEQAAVDFRSAAVQPRTGDLVEELQFLVPRGAALLLDDVLLFEPGK